MYRSNDVIKYISVSWCFFFRQALDDTKAKLKAWCNFSNVIKVWRSRKLLKAGVFNVYNKLHTSFTLFQGIQELHGTPWILQLFLRDLRRSATQLARRMLEDVPHIAWYLIVSMWHHILSQNVRHDIISNINHIMWWTSDSSNHEIGGLKSCVNHGDFIGLMSVRSFYWLKVLVAVSFVCFSFILFHFIPYYSFVRSFSLWLICSILSLTHTHSRSGIQIWYNLIIHSFSSFDSGLDRVSIPRVWPDQCLNRRRNVEICQSSKVAVSEETLSYQLNPEGRMNTSNFPFAWPIPYSFPTFFLAKKRLKTCFPHGKFW